MSDQVLLAVGDSHCTDLYGQSWADHLAALKNYKLVRAGSAGAGNAYYIEKLHYALKNNKVDLCVIQLSEPTRIVTGFKAYERPGFENSLDNQHSINDIGCYTWNAYNNDRNFKSLLGTDTSVDEVWIPQVSLSKWVDYKVMQDVMTMQYLCETFNTPCVFWSWFVPMENLFIEPYSWLKEKIKWIPYAGNNWYRDNNVKSIPNDGHFGTEANLRLTKEWLIPELDKLHL